MADGPATRVGVLLVDDHKMFSDSLARVLADEPDIEIVGTAATGASAISMAQRLQPTYSHRHRAISRRSAQRKERAMTSTDVDEQHADTDLDQLGPVDYRPIRSNHSCA